MLSILYLLLLCKIRICVCVLEVLLILYLLLQCKFRICVCYVKVIITGHCPLTTTTLYEKWDTFPLFVVDFTIQVGGVCSLI